jgi:hypothetical protein
MLSSHLSFEWSIPFRSKFCMHFSSYPWVPSSHNIQNSSVNAETISGADQKSSTRKCSPYVVPPLPPPKFYCSFKETIWIILTRHWYHLLLLQGNLPTKNFNFLRSIKSNWRPPGVLVVSVPAEQSRSSISSVVTKINMKIKKKKSVTMTTNHRNKGAEPTPETSCTPYIPHTWTEYST